MALTQERTAVIKTHPNRNHGVGSDQACALSVEEPKGAGAGGQGIKTSGTGDLGRL
jgi:hypothetical protein